MIFTGEALELDSYVCHTFVLVFQFFSRILLIRVERLLYVKYVCYMCSYHFVVLFSACLTCFLIHSLPYDLPFWSLVWGVVGWSGGGDVRHYSIVRADLWYLDIVYTVCTLTLHISFCLLLF